MHRLLLLQKYVIEVAKPCFVINVFCMRNFIFASLVLIILVIFSACTGGRIIYFNDINLTDRVDSVSIPPLYIQSGDILQVTISTINRDVSALYNPAANLGINNAATQGYLVDSEGNIDLPMIGKIYVRGKTTESINNNIKAVLENSLKSVFVSTRLINFKISILGDVARPGNYGVSSERITILEALSLAGDVNLSAKKEDVLLIREKEGKKKYISINLLNSKTLSSPYYYLTNNDVLYVKPGVNRAISNATSIQVLPIVASAVTLLLILYNNTIR